MRCTIGSGGHSERLLLQQRQHLLRLQTTARDVPHCVSSGGHYGREPLLEGQRRDGGSELLDASGKSHLLSAEYLLLLLLGGLKTRVGAGGDGLSHSSSSSSSSSSLLLLLLLLESVLSEEEELCMLLTEVTVQGPC